MRQVHHIVVNIIGLIAATFIGSACSPGNISEEKLGPFHANASSLVVSKDGSHIAYQVTEWREDGKRGWHEWFVVVDGRPSPVYEWIEDDTPIFSPDGSRVGYAGFKGNKWHVVVDGIEGPGFDRIVRTDEFVNAELRRVERRCLTFSPDGSRVAYAAEKGQKFVVVVDGRAGPEYDTVGNITGSTQMGPIFSSDGKHIAYAAREGNKEFIVVDGEPGFARDWRIHKLAFFPGGSQLAFLAEKGGNWFFVVNDQVHPAYDKISIDDNPVFSPDGRHMMYTAKLGSKKLVIVDGRPIIVFDSREWKPWVLFSKTGRLAYVDRIRGQKHVIVDGKIGQGYDNISNLSFSRDGGNLAYIAYDLNKEFVVVDGKAGPIYDSIRDRSIIFSPDGKRIAYVATKNKKQFVIVDGKQQALNVDYHTRTVFSPDSSHLAYVVPKGSKFSMVVDGHSGPEFTRIGDGSSVFTGAPIFSPNSERLAYVAQKAVNDPLHGHGTKMVVVVDGQLGPDYEHISEKSFAFSPDSNHFAYVADTKTKQFVIIDHDPGPEFDRIITKRLSFRSDGTLEYLAVRSGTLYRVKHVTNAALR